MASGITLDEVVFWTPPVAASRECASQAQHAVSTSISLPELSSQQEDGQRNRLRASRKQTSEEPILVPSDTESDAADTDGEGEDGGGGDYQDADGSRTDDTLPSGNTFVASITKALPHSANNTDNLSKAINDENGHGHTHRLGSPTDGSVSREATTSPKPSIFVPTSPAPASPSSTPPPTIAQSRADEASTGDTESALRQFEPVFTPRAATQSDDVVDTPEACSSIRHRLGVSDAQDAGTNDREPDVTEEEPCQCTLRPTPRAQASPNPHSAHHDDDEPGQDVDGISGQPQWCKKNASIDTMSDDGVHHHEEYYPSPPDSNTRRQKKDSRASGTDDDAEQPARKRHKLGQSATAAERPRRRSTISHYSNASDPSTPAGEHTPTHCIHIPPASGALSEDGDIGAAVAQFKEWPLENAMLKRVIVNGRATFQLQFDWDSCIRHSQTDVARYIQSKTSTAKTRSQARQGARTRAPFTPAQDTLLIRLKEGRGNLSWLEIHTQFSAIHPGRSLGTLQSHYHMKLKRREADILSDTSAQESLPETSDFAPQVDTFTQNEEHDLLEGAGTGGCLPTTQDLYDIPMELIDPDLRTY